MLRVFGLFTSISGEVGDIPQGSLVQFVRFGGCNLTCPYCDTARTQPMDSGVKMPVEDIVQTLLDKRIKNVILTGGEPLMQDHTELSDLVQLLHEKRFKISVETNGTVPIPLGMRHYCTFVMDYKFGYINLMQDQRFLALTRKDFIKFPIDNKETLEQAITIQTSLEKKGCVAKFAYSPIFDRSIGGNVIGFDRTACSEACKLIVNRLFRKRMDAVLNLQIHKVIDVA